MTTLKTEDFRKEKVKYIFYNMHWNKVNKLFEKGLRRRKLLTPNEEISSIQKRTKKKTVTVLSCSFRTKA